MKVTGIIAEYNPFHLGHQYQLDTLRKVHQPDYIIASISGNFVQRGGPALVDKYARTKMALAAGVDLVLELPTLFASASAESFAQGGVQILASTGLVDALCFGVENTDLPRMQELAELLLLEKAGSNHKVPASENAAHYQQRLQNGLRQGLSYPAARAQALPEYADLLASPNNILALEYLKAITAAAPHITPYPIQRQGAGYHDDDLAKSSFPSATAIRQHLKSDGGLDQLAGNLPQNTLEILSQYRQDAPFLWEDDFSLLLHHSLLIQEEHLTDFLDVPKSLANRFRQQLPDFLSWSQFCQLCKSRDMTYTRISRSLTHILLNVPAEISAAPTAPYLRILGFRKSAAPLLHELKQTAQVPIITSPARLPENLSSEARMILDLDLYSAQLYRSLKTSKTGLRYSTEYQQQIITI